MASCLECGADIKVWHHVLKCDRCLAAAAWANLQRCDYVLLRRNPEGTVYLDVHIGGNHRGTNMTAMHRDHQDVRDAVAAAVAQVQEQHGG